MYLVLKFLHIAAVILFLGNVITGLFWHAHAARTRDPRLIAHVVDGIIRSDRFFTIPGVFGIIAAGVPLAMVGHFPILGTTWILWTIVLFAISGGVFMGVVAPLQKKLRAMAEAGASSGAFDHAEYRKLAVRWKVWGLISVATPLGGVALMVLKPSW
jgi:uncharacterized membrane protein